jgi:hypothetical protein
MGIHLGAEEGDGFDNGKWSRNLPRVDSGGENFNVGLFCGGYDSGPVTGS